MDAYLDVETTGLTPFSHKLTVVGLCLGNGGRVLQWIAPHITAERVLKVLERAATTTIYTYNGTYFDLPFLRYSIGLDLGKRFWHRDLMLDYWRRNLYGGLKAVERALSISRSPNDIDGLEAIRLWNRYEQYGDNIALRLLLDYNKEDVLNLRVLKGILLP